MQACEILTKLLKIPVHDEALFRLEAYMQADNEKHPQPVTVEQYAAAILYQFILAKQAEQTQAAQSRELQKKLAQQNTDWMQATETELKVKKWTPTK